jgi:hypothetical protein
MVQFVELNKIYLSIARNMDYIQNTAFWGQDKIATLNPWVKPKGRE